MMGMFPGLNYPYIMKGDESEEKEDKVKDDKAKDDKDDLENKKLSNEEEEDKGDNL